MWLFERIKFTFPMVEGYVCIYAACSYTRDIFFKHQTGGSNARTVERNRNSRIRIYQKGGREKRKNNTTTQPNSRSSCISCIWCADVWCMWQRTDIRSCVCLHHNTNIQSSEIFLPENRPSCSFVENLWTKKKYN